MLGAPDEQFNTAGTVAAPDYSNDMYWAALPGSSDLADLTPEGAANPSSNEKLPVDVFFIHPTGLMNGPSWVSSLQVTSKTEENTPEYLRVHLGQVFTNLLFPRNFLNDLLQGDVKQSGVELSRFTINTTVGLLGFFDPASRLDLYSRPEDLGQTLGVWGVPPGPYLHLPIIGPSGARDIVAFPEGVATTLWISLISPAAGIAVGATETVNTRALNDATLTQLRDSSLDYYVAVRNGYRQRREALVRNGEVEEEPPDDLYDLEEDEEGDGDE